MDRSQEFTSDFLLLPMAIHPENFIEIRRQLFEPSCSRKKTVTSFTMSQVIVTHFIAARNVL